MTLANIRADFNTTEFLCNYNLHFKQIYVSEFFLNLNLFCSPCVPRSSNEYETYGIIKTRPLYPLKTDRHHKLGIRSTCVILPYVSFHVDYTRNNRVVS